MGLLEGVVGLVSFLIGVSSNDPPCEVEEAAELEMGIAAAWASRALSLGNSGGSTLLGDLSADA